MRSLGIGMVGHAFMGRAHSQAWRTVGHAFDLPIQPRMAVLCGRDAAGTRASAERLGWAEVETNWLALIERDDVDLVDICAPGDQHAPIALAALAAGKHVLCEKPLANTLGEAEAMVAAAERARERGVLAMVGFNYRRVPTLALARQLIAEGTLGTLRHVRASYLQDWLVDPTAPMSWRLRRETAGSGALGDLGAHLVDLVRYLTEDELSGVSGQLTTFVRHRPGQGDDGDDPVTVDDAALFTARLASGAVASFEATRYATGHKNALRLELDGEHGSIGFDLERLNELAVHNRTAPGRLDGFRRVLVTESDHPYLSAWWPPGHVLGWEHTFVHQARDLILAIADGTQPTPSFADGLAVQRVLAAVQDSAERGGWVTIEQRSGR